MGDYAVNLNPGVSRMKQYSLTEIASLISAPLSKNVPISRFEVDSRKVVPGTLFFALRGAKSDGHLFLKEAAAKGAVAAVVSTNYAGEEFGLSLLRAVDPLAALQDLARQVFARKKRIVIGVTGSVGKTTTKEFIATLLEAKFSVAKTPRSSNSQSGLPLGILNQEAEAEVFVVEMGMSERGEISKLIRIAPPDIAVVTRLGMAHAAYFPDGLQGIAEAKAEILMHPQTRLAFLNAQVAPYDVFMRTGLCEKRFFASLPLSVPCPHPIDTKLHFEEGGLRIEEKGKLSRLFTLPFTATHLCENFLAASAVARELGFSWEELFEQAQKLRPYRLRFEIVEREGVAIVNDCYNANPESMRAALTNLPKPQEGRKRIGVLGAMRPLGSFAEKCHIEIGQMALDYLDEVLCFGEEMRAVVNIFAKAKRPADFFGDLPSLRTALFERMRAGDVVLIKGSNDNAMWKILEGDNAQS
jgi:UDP-N-acetylmuramoyl-tripeptide--D-alanyl-D-alanine ligase